MDINAKKLSELIRGMRSAYARGENAMAYAREMLQTDGDTVRNQRLATLIAYDLQAGKYVEFARNNPKKKKLWCDQVAGLISPLLPFDGSLLEVGVGEGTTLSGVLDELGRGQAFGFDISWSRIKVANEWLQNKSKIAELFVGDLLNIPLADNSIDVVYSSHSLEPNGGLEKELIYELLRVSRNAVVLIEPLYELAPAEAKTRMRYHGYVRGLREAAERLGAEVIDYRLLDYVDNPLNPSGVLALRKPGFAHPKNKWSFAAEEFWQCPLTGARLIAAKDGFAAPDQGIVYPVLQGIPLLRKEHAVVASHFMLAK